MMKQRAVPIVQAFEAKDLQLAQRVQGGDDDDDDDASMGKLLRTYGLAHSVAEGCHVLSSTMGVFIWGMATVGLFMLQGMCDDTSPEKLARCWDDQDCRQEYDANTGTLDTVCPGPCTNGVPLSQMCDIVDGALLALNLSLGPQVLVLTALVMFTSVQVACHTCCFGETTKKGAAFTYMLFCIIGAVVSIWTMVEGYIFIEDLKQLAEDLGTHSEADADAAADTSMSNMVEAVNDSPVMSFWLFTTFVTFCMRVAGAVLKFKKHGMCC